MRSPFLRRFAAPLLVGLCCCQGIQAEPAQPSASAPAISVTLLQDRLSLRAKNVALGRILKTLETKAGVHFKLHDPLAGRVPVTLAFQDQPLREGIRAILEGHSYCIAGPSGSARLRVTVLAAPPGDEIPDPAAPRFPAGGAAPGSELAALPPPPASMPDEAVPVESVGGDSGWSFDKPPP